MPHPFIAELRELLEKHNAAIYWSCHWASDLHGVTDQQMSIEVDCKEVASVDGSSICAGDLGD
jgi:UDP-3-O-acyl-N-acetylglucosamine deacetylase